MKGTRMPGLLCRSYASTAVCVPGDPRSVVVPRRPNRTIVESPGLLDLKYGRLPPRDRRHAVTLPMVMKKDSERVDPPKLASNNAAFLPPPPPPPPPSNDLGFQVVVMRVSIHCQGCAGKVKKHISKMEGVTSFSIDLESKRVTVMGHVSPAGVLESISKVKKAEFWTC